MSGRLWITVLFVLTVAVSSALLFILQPMCARMLLPFLGGSPSVWTSCMLFFQAGLLGGYVYAHASSRMGLRTHAVLHVALLVLACAFLPPVIGRPFLPENSDSPVLWLLASLLAAIGLPYLVLASSAPLLQLWLARAGSGAVGDPYFLYAASNVGSLIGLFGYPFLLEPLLGLHQQSYVWSGCFGLFAVLTCLCALFLWKMGARNPDPVAPQPSRGSKTKNVQPLCRNTTVKWLFLAFLPSSLLLAVTVHLTADVASLPFLWVVPLGIYLITYIVAFSVPHVASHHFWIRWLPLVVLTIVVVLLSEATEPLLLIVFLHLLGLFWIGMVCHGELARTRPPVENLTGFYFWIALGGALGGAFNTLVAPALFHSLAEYPVALVLACLVPAFATSHSKSTGPLSPQWRLDLLLPALLALLTCGLAFAVHRVGIPRPMSVGLIFGLPLVTCYTFAGRPIRFGLGITALLLSSNVFPSIHGKSEERVRSFFGVHRVMRHAQRRVLVHGNTEHGRQSLQPARRGEPLAYYSRSGPIGELMRALSPADARLQNVAVLGLGAGTLAAYAQAGDHWTFYEIDPAVVRLARQDFTYLQDAIDRGVNINIVVGDARFQISRTRDKYGLIILDAFSSDSIPIHLFTREAISTYRDRLMEDGILAIHYSSRYFNLRPVLGNVAKAGNPPMRALFREDLRVSDQERSAGKSPSNWSVFVQRWDDLSLAPLFHDGWHPLEADGSQRPWTDDHANVLGALRMFPD